jgi:hypothetical protein
MDGVQEPAPERRIGDRERREVDDHLQQAHADGVLTLTEYDERSAQCWAARTRSELEALTRDLPDPAPHHPPVPTRTAPPKRPSGRRRAVVGTALLGVALFGGTQVVLADDASAVFGSRVVQLTPGQDRVDVGVLFGNVEVVVPDDARVDTRGVMVFGGTDCEAACDGTGTRTVTVDASGGFGSVDIVRQGERTARDGDGRDRGDRDDDRDDRDDGGSDDGDDD